MHDVTVTMGNVFCRTKYYSKAELDPDEYHDKRGANLTVTISNHPSLRKPLFFVEAFLGLREEGEEIKRTVCGTGRIDEKLDLEIAWNMVQNALLRANCPTYLTESIVETALHGSSDVSISSPMHSEE